ncbi:autotransporter outer membrane beta-barrel domain-containing protein [Nissabacter archeti]|uniref:Autotransporter outer membrane beta-barrel domain-containing protein n=1 Tax=Nissabacter archeti TaxID=1917880 RepID=A0ABS5JKU8_9GAMM|nr:autotransporter outer membrane beta-barrel domain-containing protein [Nissabacter archeti]MBS0970542.1 autotransporter outer membrane beta-barrel domain-containing protein [Nissabacter archeti]
MPVSHKKFSLSKITLACALALTSSAALSQDISGSSFDTFTHGVDINGHVHYQGYVDWDNTAAGYDGSDIYPVINNAVVNGVISTYYLDDGAGDNNTLTLSNTTVNGMITSGCMTGDCSNTEPRGNYLDPLSLVIDNTTINDTYEHYIYDVTDADQIRDFHQVDTYALGTAITLDQESNITIQNNSHVAGISLSQGYDWADVNGNSAETFDNNVQINDSVLTSGAYSELDKQGFYGQSDKPSDYNTATSTAADDIALSVVASADADNAMKTNVVLNNSTMTGDVAFVSYFDNGYYVDGHDSNGDGVLDTDGWDNTDELHLTLDNGSKWVGAATSSVQADTSLYDHTTNSRWPASVYNSDYGHLTGDAVYQSGLFDIAINNGSEWDATKASNLDNLTVNNASQVTVQEASILADTITLTNGSLLNIAAHGDVATDDLHLDSGSRASLVEESAHLYANTLTVSNGAELDLGRGQVDTQNLVLTDNGVFDIGSREFVLNADLNNARDKTAADYVYDSGVIGLNSDGHLSVNGTANGNYQVRIDNATGAGSVADYKDKELIRIYGGNATFTDANEADLGAYRYQAEQRGDVVVLDQKGLTSSANAALSLPSSNASTWHMEQDTLDNRMDNVRHTANQDKGGVWVNYFGGNLNTSNDVVDYDQDVNGVMVGLDKVVEGGGEREWLVGMSASFAKSSLSMSDADADSDSQSARVYSSLMFNNGVFVDSSLSYSHFSNDLDSTMSNGQHASGDNTTDAWGFGLKLGYDWAFQPKAYLTPYASITGVFVGDDDYTLNNGMNVSDQAYDSIRYELGADIGYTFEYAGGQAFTPYASLAYVYESSSNDAQINGDRIDNGVDGSAVRVGLGGQFEMSKNFSIYADANYLGGSDVDQPWAANLGVKYRW